jgi:hypothetical protein
MQDRRHAARSAARFVALAAAALAVAGTSAATPSPPPSQQVASSGSAHLTAERPVILQPISIGVESGQVRAIGFDVRLDGLPADGSVVAAFRALDPEVNQADVVTTGPSERGRAAEHFVSTCSELPCALEFVLVLTWLDPPASGAADVSWALTTSAEFAGSSGASPQVGRVVVRTAEATSPDISVGSTTAGPPAHLTEADRFRIWEVQLDRDRGKTAAPGVALARLSFSATQTAGDAFGGEGRKDRRLTGRQGPPVQARVLIGSRRFDRWASDGPIDFDPFPGCSRDETCRTVVTIELAWADGRPEGVFDARWTLDLVSTAPTSDAMPIKPTVRAVEPPELVSTTASGAFETSFRGQRGQSTFSASAPSALDPASRWNVVVVPARAVLTATVTSVGSVPLPADAEILVSIAGGPRGGIVGAVNGGQIGLRPGETGRVAWEPSLACAPATHAVCALDGTITAALASPSPNSASGELAVHVEWSLAVALPVVDDGSLRIAVDAAPSPSR